MRLAAYLFLSIGFLVSLGNRNIAAAPIDRSVSASRQFIIYGTTAPLRGAVADVAERTKANVLNVLQLRDEWKTPIIIHLQFRQANVPELPAAALRFSQTGSGLKIQIDLTIADDFDVLAVRRQLLRGILLEMMYRRAPDLPAGSVYVEAPDWLIEGLLAADPLQERSAMIDAVTSLLAENRTPNVEQFLQEGFALLDSSAQLLYRGYALAFLQLLLGEPGGPVRLAGYLNDLSRDPSDPTADLRTHFPVLTRAAETDALWKASLASLSTRRYELFTAAETERQLDQLLGTGKTEGVRRESNGLLRFAKKKPSTSELAELRQLQQGLMLLGGLANPSFKNLVTEYAALVERLLNHKTKGLAARLDNLASKRAAIHARVSQIDDYINWYEATKADTESGAFATYLRAVNRSDELRSRRRDPISVYLDALEEQF